MRQLLTINRVGELTMYKLINRIVWPTTLVLLYILVSCKQMSELVTDDSAGLNGGFEISQNGLPVNWLMYTSNTVADSKFEIILDQEYFVEGKQSLKFEIESCSSYGGTNSPGFTQQFDVTPEQRYEISFWTMNSGTQFQVKAGSVSPMTGDMKILFQSDSSYQDWKQHKLKAVTVKKDEQLRIEVNILRPGSFWIDDIKILEI